MTEYQPIDPHVDPHPYHADPYGSNRCLNCNRGTRSSLHDTAAWYHLLVERTYGGDR
jgi:hypothetical protein